MHTQKTLVAHYQSLLAMHGHSPKALQWANEHSQRSRFSILADVATPLTSVLDVGCGLADLYQFLKAKGFDGRYLGVDIVPEFVLHSQKTLHHDKKASARLIRNCEQLPKGYDYVVASGIFNNKRNQNAAFMREMLKAMYDVAGKGIAFNAMSRFVTYRDENLYYTDPLQIFRFCKNVLGGHPVLRHEYSLSKEGFPFEYAMYVYKKPLYAGPVRR